MGCIRVRGLEHPHHPRAPAPPLSRSENLKKTCRSVLQKSKAPDDICRNPTKYRIWTSSQLYCARLNKLTAEIMLACKWCLILHSLIKSKKIAQHMFFSTLWVRPNGCLYKKRSTFIWTFQLKVNSSSFVICLTQMTHTHAFFIFWTRFMMLLSSWIEKGTRGGIVMNGNWWLSREDYLARIQYNTWFKIKKGIYLKEKGM